MNIEDLQNYIDRKIQESLHLDYKASPALQKKKGDEICKDVSAMANADGGIIIYGIEEKGHLPEKLDNGVPNNEMDREWLEQILQSRVSPKLPDLKIIPIDASSTSTYYVLDIKKSYSGPHQAPDKKYYKRYNFKSSPMDDYEIRDIKNRQLTVERLVTVNVEVKHDIIFTLVVENIGKHPAENVTFSFSPELAWDAEKPRLFVNGTRFLPPGRKFQFWYLSGPDILGESKKEPIKFTVTVDYFHPELNLNHSETFIFDFRDFIGSQANSDPLDSISKEIQKGFKEVAKALNNK